MPFSNYTCYLYQHKIKTFGIFTAHWLWIMGNKFDIILDTLGMQLCWIGFIFWLCIAWRRDCAIFELYMLLVPTQNQDIWNFHGSLTLNNGKLSGYFGGTRYAIVLNSSHFSLFCVAWRRDCSFFELYVVTFTNTKWRHLEFLRLAGFE